MAEILVEQGALDRARVLLLQGQLEGGEPGRSATVTYFPPEQRAEHRDGSGSQRGSSARPIAA